MTIVSDPTMYEFEPRIDPRFEQQLEFGSFEARIVFELQFEARIRGSNSKLEFTNFEFEPRIRSSKREARIRASNSCEFEPESRDFSVTVTLE